MKKLLRIVLVSTLVISFSLIPVHAKEKKDDFLSWLQLRIKAQESINGLENGQTKNIPLFVSFQKSNANNLDLTKERIQTKCELRLRQSGFNPVNISETIQQEVLSVTIQVVGFAFNSRNRIF